MKKYRWVFQIIFIFTITSCGGGSCEFIPSEPTDNDGDGYYADQAPIDCDDSNPLIYPGATELCDGENNNCDARDIVDENCIDCSLYMIIGSTVNISNGGLSHDQSLFEGLTLYYNSLNSYNESLGSKWNHSYDIRVFESEAGYVLLRDARGKMKLYNLSEDNDSGQLENYTSGDTEQLANYSSDFSIYSSDFANFSSDFSNYSGDFTNYSGDFSNYSGDFANYSSDFSNYSGLFGNNTSNNSNEPENYDIVYVSPPGDYSILTKTDGLFTLRGKDGRVTKFNGDGKILSVTDRNGNSLTFTYIDGHLSSVTDSENRITTFTISDSGLINMIESPSGNKYSFYYNGSGNLIEVVYPQSDGSIASWKYTYYDESYLHSKTDFNNYVVTYYYDDKGRVTSSESNDGSTRHIEYNQENKETKITAEDGGLWNFTYDDLLGVTTNMVDPEGGITAYTHDNNRNRISTTDPAGNVTYSTYDENGNRTSKTDAEGNSTFYTFGEYGKVSSVTDPEGYITTFIYDQEGNLLQKIDPTGAITSYEYDTRGNVTMIIDAMGRVTSHTYDDQNNLKTTTDPTGATTIYEYNAQGKMTSQTNSNSNNIQMEYDSLGQLIKVIDPFNVETTYTYDQKGNRASQTDANGNTTYYEYNNRGKLVKEIDALGNITQYNYEGDGCSTCGSSVNQGKLLSITDANGNKTIFDYDYLGRLLMETDPLGNSITYEYNLAGNMISKTDAEGNTIYYEYDKMGRLIKKVYPDNSLEVYTFDARGNIVTTANKDMGYSFTYDVNNRITSVIDSNGLHIKYEYDEVGNRIKMISPDGEITTYTYDESNHIKEIVRGEVFTFNYDELGRRSSLTYPNGVVAISNYDAKSRLTNIEHLASDGTLVASNAYTHDNVGNRLSNTSHERKADYQYDNIYRLKEANYTTPGWSTTTSHKGGAGITQGIANAIEQQTEIYTYDSVGNRLTSEHSKVYTYNEGNQLVTFNGTNYKYDKNGNLIFKTNGTNAITYSYDYENRLVKVTKTSGEKTTNVTFKYNSFGRRIEKKVTVNGLTNTIRYFYDKEDILFEYDENGNLGNRYIHGPGIDEPLALISKMGTYYYHSDALGSIIALSDNNQNDVQTYDYYYFGKLKNQKGRIKQPYRFTGREWDKELGLYYYRARYYDADVGRFTQKDPIGFKDGTNLYLYVKANPVNDIDPSGEAVSKCSRPLESWAANVVASLLGYQHVYLWVDSMTPDEGQGFGLAPRNNYFAWTGFGVEGYIKIEPIKSDCETVTDDPCLELKVERIIKIEQKKSQTYKLYTWNCYDWRDEVIDKMNGYYY